MSPTSLRNHRAQRRSPSVRPVPPHRRALAFLRTISKRARVLIVLTLLILTYRLATRPRSARSPHPASSAHATGASRAPGQPLLELAPSKVRPPSAKLRFADGRVQEVFPNGAVAVMGEQAGYEAVWKAHAIERVELPVGGRLSFVYEGGGVGRIESGQGDDCAGERCDRIDKVRLELDLLRGLAEFKVAGEWCLRRLIGLNAAECLPSGVRARESRLTSYCLLWVPDLADALTLTLPCQRAWPSNAVTLITQFTLSRLSRFERTLREWDGPISVTVYLTDQEDVIALDAYLRTSAEHLARFSPTRVALTVVKPDYSLGDGALVARLRYPINRLRNLALGNAPSEHVVVTDADFVPSPGMHALLAQRGVGLIAERHARRAGDKHASPTLRRIAVAVSAFALAPGYSAAYPSTPQALSRLVFEVDPPLAALTDANAGHGPSMPSLVLRAGTTSHRHATKDLPADWSFPVAYEPQWEPYYLLHRASHPLYDERFSDQGGDKQSHALLLNALGFEFHVLRDVWFMHPPKRLWATDGDAHAAKGADEIDEAWPGARLVQKANQQATAAGGAVDEAEGRREDHDPAHFSHAQRDAKRFRYFQDFLPEMEGRWGANVRWPRGADARVVAGGRSFGRARAGAVFGL